MFVTKVLRSGEGGLWKSLQSWAVGASRFRQLGLYRDDLYCENDPNVVEAINRLPENLKQERHFRIARALDLSMKQAVLPKEQWPTDDTEVRYLGTYLKQVEKEAAEREAWNNQ
eukprot:Nk52_evm5s239 gene=Nk52_evmTU5s239